MKRLQALYVTLRVPDPAALTALGTLRSLPGAAPAALERGQIWLEESQEGLGNGAFANLEGVWFNPNKERGVRWPPSGPPDGDGPLGGLPPLATPDAFECWLLVRDRAGRPEAPALRALEEQGVSPPAGLVTAALWRLAYAGVASAADAAEAARQAAEVRSTRHGLLVNPHSQAFRLCAPPGSLEELGRLLHELRNEASAS